jgi:hypothetical protein
MKDILITFLIWLALWPVISWLFPYNLRIRHDELSGWQCWIERRD